MSIKSGFYCKQNNINFEIFIIVDKHFQDCGLDESYNNSCDDLTESTSISHASHTETYLTENKYTVTQPVRPSSLTTAHVNYSTTAHTHQHTHSSTHAQYKTQHTHYQPNPNVQALYAHVKKDHNRDRERERDRDVHHQPSPDPWAGVGKKGLSGPPASLAEQLKQVLKHFSTFIYDSSRIGNGLLRFSEYFQLIQLFNKNLQLSYNRCSSTQI